MTSGFRIESAALGTHAGKVDEFGRRMRLAAAAGQPLGLGAYGIVGQVFAVAVAGCTRNGSLSVGSLADAAESFGDGLRATQAEYAAVEQRHSAVFGGIR